MKNRFLLPLLALLPALAGCRHCADDPTPPAPPCYSGVIIDERCYDGWLIEVDAATPIGRPYGSRNNVIGALNVTAIGSLGRIGQRLYFTCGRDTMGFTNFGPCPAYGVPANVPHVVLTTFSATSCSK